MPAPKWVRNFIQPIAIRDVLHYLVRAADLPSSVNRALDIGGPDVFRYGQLMNGYALEAGLKQRPSRLVTCPHPVACVPVGESGDPHSPFSGCPDH